MDLKRRFDKINLYFFSFYDVFNFCFVVVILYYMNLIVSKRSNNKYLFWSIEWECLYLELLRYVNDML